jgi:hypothetical protein
MWPRNALSMSSLISNDLRATSDLHGTFHAPDTPLLAEL